MSDRIGVAGVARVFYQELRQGDLLKHQAESNQAATGGGARDLRISPEAQFRPLFERLFPGRRMKVSKGRNVSILYGPVRWSPTDEREVEVWPPTDPRPYELRIAQINKSFPAIPEGGRVFVLLIQNDRHEVWGHYVTEADIRDTDFNPRVSKTIIDCIDRTPPHRSVRGFLDLESGGSYCHTEY